MTADDAPQKQEPQRFQYKRRDDADLKQLAMDILGRKVFGSWMVSEADSHLLSHLFMNIGLASPEVIQELRDAGVVAWYEHLSEAGPRGLNGYPTFFSCQFLDKEDAGRLDAWITKLKAVFEATTLDDPTPDAPAG